MEPGFERTLLHMDDAFQRESANLAKSWMQHDSGMLRDYLVSGVEDPRINVQSVLMRHSLLVALFGSRFERLLEAELRFAAVMNWALCSVLEEAGSIDDLRAIHHALEVGADDAEGIAVPRFVASAFVELPATLDGVVIPNYLEDWLNHASLESAPAGLNKILLSTLGRAWAEVLALEAPSHLSVLELACGSANDYRFFDAFGLAKLIDYTGLDLCDKNIENALAMFPHIQFRLGNALAIDSPDRAYDCCIAQDLFEHLSFEGLERALNEICRVTRRELCLGFFNMHEGEEHLAQPVEDYHWNQLSLPRIRAGLEQRGFKARVVHIETLLRRRLGCAQTHNTNAYTVMAERPPNQP